MFKKILISVLIFIATLNVSNLAFACCTIPDRDAMSRVQKAGLVVGGCGVATLILEASWAVLGMAAPTLDGRIDEFYNMYGEPLVWAYWGGAGAALTGMGVFFYFIGKQRDALLPNPV